MLETDESIYIDSNMGHAYVAADGCDEATVIGVCSSADEGLMESLLELHDEEEPHPSLAAAAAKQSASACAAPRGATPPAARSKKKSS